MENNVERIELTEEEKNKIIEFWNSRPTNPPSFRELIDNCLGKNVDSRSKLARELKEFLASRKIVAKNATNYEPKGEVELTNEQKEYIRNARLAPGIKPSFVEIARTLFENDKITPLSREARTVSNEIKRIESELDQGQTEVLGGEYDPPNSIVRALARIKKYTKREFKENDLSPRQKKEIESLINYLQSYRFTAQINTYVSQRDRDLFESQFIRFTYDKHDLTEEELEQYILLSTDAVTLQNIQKNIKKLTAILDDVTDDEDGKISMGLTDAITSARKEYNECFTRQDKILKNLVGTRAQKISKQGERRMSLVEMVEVVQDEKKRHLLATLAEQRKHKIKDEVERIKTLDDLVIQVYGLDENEILGE